MDLKLIRARELLAELAVSVRQELPGLWSVVETPDFSAGEMVGRLQVNGDIPQRWPALVGDIVHNARAALDHLAWQLVLSCGGEPGRQTAFPIVEDASKAGAAIRSALRGCSVEVRDEVRSLKPWKGGNEFIQPLHELDIIDKHRLILPVLGRQFGMELLVEFLAEDGVQGPDDILFPIGIPGIEQPVVMQGMEVSRRSLEQAAIPDDFPIKVHDRPLFQLVFGPDTPLEDEGLIDGLTRLVNGIEVTIQPLLRRLSSSDFVEASPE